MTNKRAIGKSIIVLALAIILIQVFIPNDRNGAIAYGFSFILGMLTFLYFNKDHLTLSEKIRRKAERAVFITLLAALSVFTIILVVFDLLGYDTVPIDWIWIFLLVTGLTASVVVAIVKNTEL